VRPALVELTDEPSVRISDRREDRHDEAELHSPAGVTNAAQCRDDAVSFRGAFPSLTGARQGLGCCP
jgi:hypothetical protein